MVLSNFEQPLTLLNEWYKQPIGKALAESIQQELNALLPHLAGQHLLQIGLPDHQEWLKSSTIPHKFCLVPEKSTVTNTITSDYLEIPFVNGCIDVVLLPHTLVFVEQPFKVMKEINRILAADGCLIIIGFNALSFWGLWQGLFKSFGKIPWNRRFLTTIKVRRFLNEYAYDIEQMKSFFYRPPINQSYLLQKLRILETIGKLLWPYPGSIYLILAKKRTYALTGVQPILSFRNLVIGKRFAHPSANS